MKIGFTYDLKDEYLAQGHSPADVAELDSRVTIDGIEDALVRLGHQVDRIGKIASLVDRLAAGDRWDLVFNIAEGIRGSAREAQVPGLLEAYGMPVTFGDALCLAVCLDKALTKQVMQGHGIPTPRFAVVRDVDRDMATLNLAYPVFAKPIGEGSGIGVSAAGKAATPDELRAICQALLASHRQPVLVEEYLPGREFTVGIVGTGEAARVLGVMEVNLLDNAEPSVYSYANKAEYEDRVAYRLADDDEARAAAGIALAAYRALGCRDAGRADLRSGQDGRPQFMEINPLAGLNPLHSDLPILCRLLGQTYDQLIRDIIQSASERVGENRQCCNKQ